jgi:Zn-finger nucleic acid-binding protein/predicted transcriptional regulator
MRACPGCGTAMRRQGFARKPVGAVDLDLCLDCQAIWFDAFESAQLTPASVIELFRLIDAQRDRSPHPLATIMRCVACRGRLVLTHDIERTNRIVYYRCPEGHGRFTTFLQFLREKNFVRSLTPVEIERLKATVAQVRCSGCGAPVDIARDADCPYCHAPISILDADAVRRTLDELGEQERRSHQVDPAAAIDAVLEGRRVERRLAAAENGMRWNEEPVDLVHEALAMLTSAMPESR